jgi:anti-sigma regulatory factor (Ser/Thr protein kinase)
VTTPVPTGTRQATVDLPPVSDSVPAARHVLALFLRSWSAESVCEHAVLLVSELVTNVVRHVVGRAALTVEVTLTDALLHVGVVDTSATPPTRRVRTSAGGHGMWLVAATAHRWGSEHHDHGKRVWFELCRDRRPPEDHRAG